MNSVAFGIWSPYRLTSHAPFSRSQSSMPAKVVWLYLYRLHGGGFLLPKVSHQLTLNPGGWRYSMPNMGFSCELRLSSGPRNRFAIAVWWSVPKYVGPITASLPSGAMASMYRSISSVWPIDAGPVSPTHT